MKSRRLLIGSALALGVLLPLTAVAWLFWDDQPVSRLPDGTILRVTTVQYGIPKPILYGPTWKRRLFPLRSLLPSVYSQRIPWEPYDVSNFAADNTLTIGLARLGNGEGQLPVGELIDRHGCRFRSVNNLPGEWGTATTNVAFYPFFPRRESSLRMNVYRWGTKREEAGTFTLGNPVAGGYPFWGEEPLPATKRSGPLEVKLTGATWGWAAPPDWRLAREDEVEHTRLDYRLPERCREWRPVGITLRDAMGGSYRFDPDGWHALPNALLVRGDNHCRGEGAYEYRMEFSRALTSDQPDQVYRFGPVTPGTTRPTTFSLPDGRTLTLLYNPDGEPSFFGNWPAREGEVDRIWIIGEDGRTRSMAPLLPGGVPRSQSFNIPVPKGIRRVRLRFGVYKSQYATFRVKPRWLSAVPPR